MDLTAKIIAFEADEMAENEIPKFFQELIDNSMAWTLQGSYGRLANQLIKNGLCHPKILK